MYDYDLEIKTSRNLTFSDILSVITVVVILKCYIEYNI